MVTYMKEGWLTTKRMAGALTSILKEIAIKATGEMTCNTVKVSRSGSKAPSTRVSTIWAWRRGSASTHLQTAPHSKGNGTRTWFKGTAFPSKRTEWATRDSGMKTACKVMDARSIQMVIRTTANLYKTRSRVMASSRTLMVVNVKDGGSRVN